MDTVTLATLAPYAESVGGWLLSMYFIRMVFSGRVVPRSLYLEQKEVAAQWREAYQSERDKNRQVVIPMAESVLRQAGAPLPDPET